MYHMRILAHKNDNIYKKQENDIYDMLEISYNAHR